MTRWTLGDCKSNTVLRIPAALRMCTTDTRIAALINEAQLILLPLGTWYGTSVRYQTTVTDGHIILPDDIASVHGIAVSQTPHKIRNNWYEFIELGLGVQDADNPSDQCIVRDNWCVSSQPVGTDKALKVYCDLLADQTAAVTMTVCGYDENGDWIRTDPDGDGVYQDGVTAVVSQAGTLFKKTGIINQLFSDKIASVKISAHQGKIKLYEYDPAAGTQRQIGEYEHWETSPSYRYCEITDLHNSATSTCTATVDVQAKLSFRPVSVDADYLLIQCLPALKYMALAIYQAENERSMESKSSALAAGQMVARSFLEAESRHYRGVVQSHVTIPGTSGPTNEPIEAIV